MNYLRRLDGLHPLLMIPAVFALWFFGVIVILTILAMVVRGMNQDAVSVLFAAVGSVVAVSGAVAHITHLLVRRVQSPLTKASEDEPTHILFRRIQLRRGTAKGNELSP